jgi:hypothetical protein
MCDGGPLHAPNADCKLWIQPIGVQRFGARYICIMTGIFSLFLCGLDDPLRQVMSGELWTPLPFPIQEEDPEIFLLKQ